MDLTEEDKGDRFTLKALFNKRAVRPQTKEAFFNFEPNELMISQGRETYVIVSHDMAIGHRLFMEGESDFGKFVAALELLDTAMDVLWDVGANIGSICIPAVARGYVKRAIAFEPEERLHRLLRANAILNNVDAAIEFSRVAVGETRGTAQLTMAKGNTGDFRIAGRLFEDDAMGEAVRDVQTVPVRQLDDYVDRLELGRTLVYMDIQGYEGLALRGAAKLLKSRPPLVCEFWPYGMKRLDSYSPLRDAVCEHYSAFADLGSVEEGFKALTARALDEMYEAIGEGSNSFTDLLFVPSR